MTREPPAHSPKGSLRSSVSPTRTGSAHLLIETPEANLTAGMGWFQNAYTRRFNTRHRLLGRLFGDRYKWVIVEGRSGYYYETLLDYIHLNPVRARLVGRAQDSGTSCRIFLITVSSAFSLC